MDKDWEQFENYFPNPVIQIRWSATDALNAGLLRIIEQKKANSPSLRMSNAGGWQSEKSLLTWQGEEIKTFASMIKITTDRFCEAQGIVIDPAHAGNSKFVGWANVNGPGDYNRLHAHGGAIWSGVYYVSVDGVFSREDHEGDLAFRAPSLASLVINNLRPPPWIRQAYTSERRIQVHPGLMVMFPSWLEHQVFPFRGPGRRVSISWDVLP